MSKILRLDPSYDLWLTYSWSGNNHGVCGHTFEVIDYFTILKDHFTVGILLAEDIDWAMFEQCIRNKYDFTDAEILAIQQHTVFCNRPTLLTGKNILFVDGGVINTSRLALYFDHVIYFACGNREICHNTNPTVHVLQDDRVYAPVAVNGINYKKRILLDRLKRYTGTPDDRALVYATKNCREVADFGPLQQYHPEILAVVSPSEYNRRPPPGVTFIAPPVEDIFAKFSTFIYTPVPRKWDCSPRFIAECKYYDRPVIYHDIDYWEVDHGLYWRHHDIEHDFDSLFLRSTDDIIPILKDII
jgi:hypothetical protein